MTLPGDQKLIPTLEYPYGRVPIVCAAASEKRLAALSDVIVWAWERHKKEECRSSRLTPHNSIVVLIDEVECHLGQQRQRTIIPALLKIKPHLDSRLHMQFLITTHSALALASVEPLFEEDSDQLFHMSLGSRGSAPPQAVLEKLPFLRHGRVDNWITSEVFGLDQARSLEAEKAIRDARDLQEKEKPGKPDIQAVHDRLVKTLGDHDSFWPRWTFFAERHGVSL